MKTQMQPFLAFVRLSSCFSVDLRYLSWARGKREISSTLGVREGTGSRLHWPWVLPSGNSEVLVPLFFLQTTGYVCQLPLNWLRQHSRGEAVRTA